MEGAPAGAAGPPQVPHTGSLARRMMLIAAGWITILLLVGGLALNSTLTGLITRSFDEQLEYTLTAMVGSVEIGPEGDVFFKLTGPRATVASAEASFDGLIDSIQKK